MAMGHKQKPALREFLIKGLLQNSIFVIARLVRAIQELMRVVAEAFLDSPIKSENDS